MVFAWGMAAYAGEYHQGHGLNCYQCHTMHYSQQHLYGYEREDDIHLGPDGPYNYLLRDRVNNLCLSCHDAGDVIDVYGESEVYVVDNRQGGFLNRVGDGNENNGHTLESTDTPPGAGDSPWTPDPDEGFTCVDCHNKHGYFGSDPNYPDPDKGQWRILNINPGNASAAYLNYDRFGDPDYPNLARDINWKASSPSSGGPYEVDNTDFYEPVSDESRYGAWCQGCHERFHGNSSDPDMNNGGSGHDPGWIRHPTAEANIGGVGYRYSDLEDFAAHPYRPQVMSSTGDWGTQGDPWVDPPTDLTPSCFSCHKSHGNGNAFGLMYMTGEVPRTENGDGERITVACKICHVQGGD